MTSKLPIPRKFSTHTSSIPARKASALAIRKADSGPLARLEIGTVEEISRTLGDKHSFLRNTLLNQPEEFYVDDRVGGLTRATKKRLDELAGVLTRLKQKAGRSGTFYSELEQAMRRGGRTFREGDVFDPANPKGKTAATRPAMRKVSPKTPTRKIKARLEYLRGKIEAENISYMEIAELQGLADYIDDNDVQLLEWAGVEEGSRNKSARPTLRKTYAPGIRKIDVDPTVSKAGDAADKSGYNVRMSAKSLKIMGCKVEEAKKVLGGLASKFSLKQDGNNVVATLDVAAAARARMSKAEGDEPTATRVTFRRWTGKQGKDVIALLWDVDVNPGRVMMYEHVGQHGEGDAGIVNRTKAAAMSEPDVKNLYDELTDMGYELTVVQRQPADAPNPEWGKAARATTRKAARPVVLKSLAELKRIAIVEPDPRIRAGYAEELAKRMTKAGDGDDEGGSEFESDTLSDAELMRDFKANGLGFHKNVTFPSEHGQRWAMCSACGASWSVVDSNMGVDFEEVDEGDESCLENSNAKRRRSRR